MRFRWLLEIGDSSQIPYGEHTIGIPSSDNFIRSGQVRILTKGRRRRRRHVFVVTDEIYEILSESYVN